MRRQKPGGGKCHKGTSNPNPPPKELQIEYFQTLMGFSISVTFTKPHSLVNARTRYYEKEQGNNDQYYIDEGYGICHSYRGIKATCRQYEQQKCHKMIKGVLHIPEAL